MRLFALIFILCSPLWAAAQKTDFSQTLQQYQQTLQASSAEAEAATTAAFGLAELYANADFERYNPDTAYSYLRAGQRQFRRLNKRKQKRVERAGYGRQQVRSLKSDIREKGLAFKKKAGSSQAMLDYIEHYSRLPHDLESAAMAAFLKLRLQELKQRGEYESIKQFARHYNRQLEEYLPELRPKLHDAAFQAYFQQQDSTDLQALTSLLLDFPGTAPKLDVWLSQLLQQKPYITKAENELRGLDFRFLPRTARVIYFYHYYTGEWSDLLGFQNRYPTYVDSFGLQRAMTVARTAPDLDKGFTNNRRPLYERYIELAAPTHKAYVALQQLITNKLEEQQWGAAKKEVERFAPFFQGDSRIIDLQRLLGDPLEGLQPVSLGDTVNSVYGEYAPVISADGQRVYFCRNIDGNEDIYMAERSADGYWQFPVALQALNTENNYEAPLAISADGSTLLMYKGGDVNYTERTLEGWSTPRPFFEEAQRPDWQGMTCLSGDKQVAIFAARSANCIGARNKDNIDLYLSYRQADGNWGPPVNLGTQLNTPFEDRSPFLHPDQRTLYFSSGGRGGFGKLDLFVTKRIGDGWMEWTEPVNLGKEINGPGYDWGYRISTDGTVAYFSTYVPGWKEELYRIGLPEAYRPSPVTTINGRLQSIEALPEEVTVVIEDLDSGEQVSIAKPDPSTGEFFVTLPLGKRYSYTIKGPGLYPISDNLDLRAKKESKKLRTAINVPSIAEAQAQGMALPLKNLFFKTDSYIIDPASHVELNRLSELVQKYGLNVEIAGHTDRQGGKAYNAELSQNRAKAVRQYLIEQGCTPQQISARGYGFNQPVADNNTAKGRAENRRVEIRFELSGG
jgi:outer membrane protein OmpA-like peptidoglycan-associated protein